MTNPLHLLLVFLLPILTYSAYGVDIAGSFSNYTCLKDNNIDLAIVRAYHSYGAIDTDAPNNIKQSNLAGLLTDVYMFPCRGKNATTQVNEMINYLDATAANSTSPYDLTYGTIWLDIETNPSSGCSWSVKSGNENCDYIQELVTAIVNKGRSVGIYATTYMWSQIVGSASGCQNFKSLPLWYAHYDNQESFSDWTPGQFGGWTTPTVKQYAGDSIVCGFALDRDYF